MGLSRELVSSGGGGGVGDSVYLADSTGLVSFSCPFLGSLASSFLFFLCGFP